jgi:hypothetical protein
MKQIFITLIKKSGVVLTPVFYVFYRVSGWSL